MEFEFEWHDAKSTSNERKHGVSFAEAETVFGDWFELTAYDPDHSMTEDRFLTMGISCMGRLLVVSYTERGDRIRIISARKPTRRERRDYEDGKFP